MQVTDIESPPSKSWLVRHGYTSADALAVVVALLLAIAYATFFLIPSWTPRMAVLVMSMPFSLVLLGRQAIRREPVALASTAFITVALLSAAFSGNFRLSVIGVIGSETGVLIFAGSFGLLALGVELTEQGRRALVWAVIAGVALSGAIGLLQILVQAESGPFVVRGGRASGLTPSSVYFGACAAGAFGVVAGRESRNPRTIPLDIALAAWFGISIGLSGTRVALGGAVVAGVVAIAMRRNLRSAASLGGLTIGVVLGRTIAAGVSPDVGVSDRLRLNGGGRTDVWRYSMSSLADRPLLGYGPGGFRRAIQDDVTVSFSARVQDNIESVWFNAHNLVFHVAATLGVLGLVALAAVTVMMVRFSRGPLAYGGLALALSWALQPFSLSTLPLALLLLGAGCGAAVQARRRTDPEHPATADADANTDAADEADRSPADPDAPGLVGSRLALLLIPGIALGSYLLVVDLSVQQAVDNGDPESAAAWVSRLPTDPLLADVVAQTYLSEARDNPEFGAATIEWGERAIDEQPERALWYIRHAERLARLGSVEDALAALNSAVEREPNSWEGVRGQYFVLDALGRDDEVEAILPLVCDLEILECDDDEASSSD